MFRFRWNLPPRRRLSSIGSERRSCDGAHSHRHLGMALRFLARAFFPKGLPLKRQLQYYASQFPTAELMACSIECQHRKPCKAGASRPATTLSSPGRHPSSSTTGNAFRKNRSTASNCWNTASRCSAARPARSCFSFRRILRRCRTTQILLQTTLQEAALQSRVPASDLVFAGDLPLAVPAQHFTLHFGPSRCAGAVETHRRFRLRSGPRSRRALQRALLARRAGGLGWSHQSWKKQGCDVYVYFDNDQKSAAPADALKLAQLLGQRRR